MSRTVQIHQSLIYQSVAFENNRRIFVSSPVRQVPLRLAKSAMTINSGQLYFSRPQPKIILNTKKGDKLLFNTPPRIFYESNFYSNISRINNVTYPPFIRSPSPQRNSAPQRYSSPQPYKYSKTYLNDHKPASPQKKVSPNIDNKSIKEPALKQDSVNKSKLEPAQHQNKVPFIKQKTQEFVQNKVPAQQQSVQQQNQDPVQQQKEPAQQQKEESLSQQIQPEQQSNQQPSDLSQQPNEIPVERLKTPIQPLPSPNLINELYEQSWRKRHVVGDFRKFVRIKKSEQDLQRNYSIRQLEQKNKLKQYCNAFYEVRGDGNCFYTAFGYQYLKLLINWSDQEYQQFLETYKGKVEFKINYDQFKIIEKDDQDQVAQYFYGTLDQLRKHPNKDDELMRRFSAYEEEDEFVDGMFYGASVLFFRNLANYLVRQSDMLDMLYDIQNLLIWETECNSNEIVIAVLAQKLNLFIQLLFFQDGGFDVKEYGNKDYNKIILLIKPGHYNIGILQQ